MADLNKLFSEITTLPLDDHGRKFPTEVSAEAFVCRAIVVLKPTNKSRRIIDGSVSANHRIVGDPLGHQNPSFL